ncbi:murein transglycosylase [Edaphobacter acidisoli]|uniref:Murein transglycosylase n=1 Tax=Edaphobacter acidisoli TaxID=2040573 RepID=A0A916RF33_9BACT|nr:transglycosylase SLT domain-containing protein [Edaphobacter acidisoli]GGA55371.1 murein transglycosylase [Edaphobacter acidisoli]
MAQQLTATRSAAAYAGVAAYARQHTGEASAAAYLALGHAYMLDHRYSEAADSFHKAATAGTALDDYADYLGAQALLQAGRGTEAYALLDHFNDRHPDSIFNAQAPVLLASSYIQQNNPQAALKLLLSLSGNDIATHNDFRYALGRAYQTTGDNAHAALIFRSLYTTQPLSFEASQARTQLRAIGVTLTAAELKAHADQLFNAKRYSEAADEYHSIEHDSSLSAGDRDTLQLYAAVCDLRLKRLSSHQAEHLPEVTGDGAALKQYILAELARNDNDESKHDAIVANMVAEFPHSRWLEEALYSSGNMYLLKQDANHAIDNYSRLYKMFPSSTYAPSAHWRTAWLDYRTRNYPEAARLMDEQIRLYPTSIEASTALYWRGRIYEDVEHDYGQAANYYHALTANYANYYYAILARERLKALTGHVPTIAPAATLSSVPKYNDPDLTGDLPENEPHLIKARLLANAALNEYIAPEIQASSTSSQWGALAQAEIYTSYGEVTRALQSMKHSDISFYKMPIDQVPTIYWKLLFPQPYWSELEANAKKNGLDPYLVASLIRQETEFNPGAISRASAYGLMQLLPSVGKSIAHREKMRGYSTTRLLDPSVNLELGTVNLRSVLDRYSGQIEYALAAYNAGDTPVRRWMSTGDYRDIHEFVESIPYSETREYVQAILRNREMYRALYPEK